MSFAEILLMMAEDDSGRVVANPKRLTRNEIRLSQIGAYVNCNYHRDISIDEMSRYVQRSVFLMLRISAESLKRHSG